jgi:hypothetical protein
LLHFFAVAGVRVLLNAATMAAMLAMVLAHYLLAQVAATVLVLLVDLAANPR